MERRFSEKPFLDQLSEISKDDANKESMISGFENYGFYNYDKIKYFYYQSNNAPKSPDMILFRKDEIVFVEFKNGRIEGGKMQCQGENAGCPFVKWDVKLKSIEGGFIILHRILSSEWKDISFTDILNLKKTFILVYNEEKNPCKNPPKGFIHNSLFRYKIRYGLDIYKSTFFHEVHTFSEDIFSGWLEKNKSFLRLLDGNKKEQGS